jgi:hypothetical protein
MGSTPVASTFPGEQSLDLVLQPVHLAWIENARRFLDPALEPDADFWTRWAAIRYLTDDFRERYRLERELVEELRPFLSSEVAERLAREGDRVFRRRLDLDRIGRRRGMASEFAAGTGQLLDQLTRWCAEIEIAARGIRREVLPAEGAEVLAHLEATLPGRP